MSNETPGQMSAPQATPLDAPFAVEVMRITKLSDGFVLNAFGNTVACATIDGLCRAVRAAAREMVRGQQVAQQSWAAASGGQPAGDAVPDDLAALVQQLRQSVPVDPTTGEPAVNVHMPASESPPEPQTAVRDEASQLRMQRENLAKLIEGLERGYIDDGAFSRGLLQSCPDLSAEEIAAALDQAELPMIEDMSPEMAERMAQREAAQEQQDERRSVPAVDPGA